MKRFLFKTLIFVLPVLALAIALEMVVRSIPNNYEYKYRYLQQYAEEVEVLVLGSSHGFYNVDPAFFSAKAFNAAHVSQSLKYDLYIFEQFKERFSSLRAIVVPIHYRSLFFELSDDPEAWRENYYAIYSGNPDRRGLTNRLELFTTKPITLIHHAIKFLLKHEDRKTVSELGFGLQFPAEVGLDMDQSGLWAVERHTLPMDRYHDDNVDRLKKLIGDCQVQGIEVLLFTPPVCNSYVENLNPAQYARMQDSILNLIKEYPNARYINFMNDSRFTDEDFYDADHLTRENAGRLTRLLDDALTAF